MTSRRKWPVITALAFVALSVAPIAKTSANPVDAFGFGARATAMGGAQAAASNDVGASYYNPAMLAADDDIRIDVGYQFARPTLRVSGLDMNVDDARGLTAGLVVPGKIAGRRLAIGAALYLPDQQINRTRTLTSQQPRFVVYDNRPQRLFLSANLALQVLDNLYIGGGMAYMSSTKGTVRLEGRIGFPNAADSELDLQMDVDLRAIRYVHAGVFYQASPWLDLGFSYRGGFALTVDQTFVITGDVGPSGDPIVEGGYFQLHTVSSDLFQPEEFSVGLNARITPTFTLAFDVQWQRWSAFDNPAANIDIILEDLGQFQDLINIPDAPPLPRPGFHDILVPHLGVEWTAAHWQNNQFMVRGGYVYEPSPAPDQFAETNFIDNDKHTLTIGTGLTLQDVTEIFPRPISIDLAMGMILLAPRQHFKVSPADSVGGYRSTGRIFQIGLSTRWRF